MGYDGVNCGNRKFFLYRVTFLVQKLRPHKHFKVFEKLHSSPFFHIAARMTIARCVWKWLFAWLPVSLTIAWQSQLRVKWANLWHCEWTQSHKYESLWVENGYRIANELNLTRSTIAWMLSELWLKLTCDCEEWTHWKAASHVNGVILVVEKLFNMRLKSFSTILYIVQVLLVTILVRVMGVKTSKSVNFCRIFLPFKRRS